MKTPLKGEKSTRFLAICCPVCHSDIGHIEKVKTRSGAIKEGKFYAITIHSVYCPKCQFQTQGGPSIEYAIKKWRDTIKEM